MLPGFRLAAKWPKQDDAGVLVEQGSGPYSLFSKGCCGRIAMPAPGLFLYKFKWSPTTASFLADFCNSGTVQNITAQNCTALSSS